MGALIVVGDGPDVLNICSGGFLLDAAFSPQRLSELAKMDGAIILAADASRIARANVHLVPNPNVPTSETGTRHRTAERVARSIDVPVISVSEDMAVVAVYARDQKHALEPIPRLLTRANQALQTLERYKDRLVEVTGSLSTLEVEDLVTVRDVVDRAAAHRDGPPGRRGDRARHRRARRRRPPRAPPARGAHGRRRRRPPPRDQGLLPRGRRLAPRRGARGAAELGTEDLLDLKAVGAALHLPDGRPRPRRAASSPAATACCRRSRGCPSRSSSAIVARFGNLQKIMRATIDDLDDVAGVGETRARAIKEGLSRLAESQHPRPLHLSGRDRTGGCARPCPPARPVELARPADGRAPTRGLVLIPDIGGLRPLFDDHAARLADEHGGRWRP